MKKKNNLSKGDVFQEMPIIEIICYTSDVLKDLWKKRKIEVPDYCSCLGNFLNLGVGESWVGKRIRYLDRQKKMLANM